MSQEFYSRGKLLISGEYFVLEGSKAFALPLKLGQSLKVNSINDQKARLTWKTSVQGEHWFWANYNLQSLELIDSSHKAQAKYLQRILLHIKKASHVFNDLSRTIEVSSNIEFPLSWGLGSSSSLISNLALWADINPFDLLFNTSEGSGFDVACARAENPIIYQLLDKPIIKEVKFNKNYLNHIYFIYSGEKQNSLQSVKKYRERIKNLKKEQQIISELTDKIAQCNTLEEFESYISEHELVVSKAINEPTVKSQKFSDFQGTIKSLGAWGGDFLMVINKRNEYVMDYFKNKKLDIIFPYKDLVYER